MSGLPQIKFDKDSTCSHCQMGKQTKASFQAKNVVSTSRPLELLHMDLFGPTQNLSIGGKKYCFVIVDDFSRLTWVIFLAHKDEVFNKFKILAKQIQNEKGCQISTLRSDHGREFENHLFTSFCEENGILQTFSSPRTPQQNGVAERKNRSLQEMARTMLSESGLSSGFWAEAINTSCYIQNRVFIRPILNKTPYELWKNRKPNISYFHIFDSRCFILNNRDKLSKFDPKSYEGIFLGYSSVSKAFRVWNRSCNRVEETIHVRFMEAKMDLIPMEEDEERVAEPQVSEPPFSETQTNEVQKMITSETSELKSSQGSIGNQTLQAPVEEEIISSNSFTGGYRGIMDRKVVSKNQIIGNLDKGIMTRHQVRSIADCAMVADFEPSDIEEAINNKDWLNAMTEELEQFKKNEVWNLVEKPVEKTIIGTR